MEPFNPTEYAPNIKSERKVIEPNISKESVDAYTENPYYYTKWLPLIKGESKLAGFNLFAMLFGGSWCVYRKQYKLAFAIFSTSILVIIATGQLYIHLIDSSYSGKRFATIVGILSMFIIVRVPLGIFANNIYFKKVYRNISFFISQGLPAEYFTAQLKSVGGVNIGGFMLCLALFGVVINITGTIW